MGAVSSTEAAAAVTSASSTALAYTENNVERCPIQNKSQPQECPVQHGQNMTQVSECPMRDSSGDLPSGQWASECPATPQHQAAQNGPVDPTNMVM